MGVNTVNTIDEEQKPAIFLEEHTANQICYFTGPWLPCSYSGELAKYNQSLEYPLQILEIPERRASLIEEMVRLSRPRQISFLNGEGAHIGELFDQLLTLRMQQKPLYKRWKQRTGIKVRELPCHKKRWTSYYAPM